MSMDNEFISQGVTEAGQEVSEFDAPDITPEDFAEHMANLLAKALSDTKMFGVVETAHGIAQVHVMGRVKREHERRFLDEVVHPILQVMEGNEDCTGFIGKQFILKDSEVRYAWVISFASNDLKQSTYDVCRSFEKAIPRREVLEAPLVGPGTPTGAVGNARGKSGAKGAAPVS